MIYVHTANLQNAEILRPPTSHACRLQEDGFRTTNVHLRVSGSAKAVTFVERWMVAESMAITGVDGDIREDSGVVFCAANSKRNDGRTGHNGTNGGGTGNVRGEFPVDGRDSGPIVLSRSDIHVVCVPE